jgi:galactonate dehydratase
MDVLTTEFGDALSYDIDFNATLIDADRGIPLLEELVEAYPQISHIEGPIPQTDVSGNARITEAIDVPTALHYGVPDPETVVSSDVCDGFVSSGGATELRRQASVAATADMPLWLQLVGTDLTAAFSLHCGAVLEQAEWPAINCHQIYDESLLTEDISVSDGYATVPDGAGLGYEVDMDVVERLEVDRPASRPNPPRLIECSWPDGPTIYFAGDAGQTLFDYAVESEAMPYFERGVETRVVPEDGSDWWERTHDDALESPVVVEE